MATRASDVFEPTLVKDPQLGVIWRQHPERTNKQWQGLKHIVERHKDSAFAYGVDSLGCYHGSVGPFRIHLTHDRPVITKARRKSVLELETQDLKCAELRDAGIIVPAPPGCKYACDVVMPNKKDAQRHNSSHAGLTSD